MHHRYIGIIKMRIYKADLNDKQELTGSDLSINTYLSGIYSLMLDGSE